MWTSLSSGSAVTFSLPWCFSSTRDIYGRKANTHTQTHTDCVSGESQFYGSDLVFVFLQDKSQTLKQLQSEHLHRTCWSLIRCVCVLCNGSSVCVSVDWLFHRNLRIGSDTSCKPTPLPKYKRHTGGWCGPPPVCPYTDVSLMASVCISFH